MKIAVISDIHGDAFTLKAVLDDLNNRGVDNSLNLGDIFYGSLAPKQTH